MCTHSKQRKTTHQQGVVCLLAVSRVEQEFREKRFASRIKFPPRYPSSKCWKINFVPLLGSQSDWIPISLAASAEHSYKCATPNGTKTVLVFHRRLRRFHGAPFTKLKYGSSPGVGLFALHTGKFLANKKERAKSYPRRKKSLHSLCNTTLYHARHM